MSAKFKKKCLIQAIAYLKSNTIGQTVQLIESCLIWIHTVCKIQQLQ